MKSNEWINVNKELPKCDGMYEVTNLDHLELAQGILHYDGYGFLHLGIYRPVQFWRKPQNLIKKKYGKVKEE